MLGIFSDLKLRLKSVWRSTHGNIATTFALALVPLMAVLGLAIDFSRTEGSARQVQYALDGAVLAAARALQDSETDSSIRSVAQDYFDAAISANGVTADCDSPSISILREDHSIQGSVTCGQPSTFAGIMGVDEVDFTRFANTAYGVGKLDVVFMFDTSGSMGNDGRMDDLQDAAIDAIATILDSEVEEEGDVRIAISTYANAVNVGSTYFEAVTNEEPDQYECTRWEKKNRRWRCKSYRQITDTCVTGREGTHKYTDAAPGSGAWMDYETTSCNSATLTPLTYNESTLQSAVYALPTSGATAGHLGIAWSWYLISPSWTSIWPTSSAPRAYDEPDSTKVAILMTDGEFNTDYMSGGDSFDHAEEFCDAMKEEGIVIYSVAFKAPDEGEEILEYCATGPGFSFKASSGQQLAAAYHTIATNISDLRLSH